MSAFSTVGDVLSDTEFSAPGNSFLWGLGALQEPIRERTGFLIMPKRPYDWVVDTRGWWRAPSLCTTDTQADSTAATEAVVRICCPMVSRRAPTNGFIQFLVVAKLLPEP